MLAINRVISFFRDPINQVEKQMDQVSAPTATESHIEQIAEPAVTETNIERMAREFFKSSFHISLVAVIEKKSNSPMANVTLFERGIGKRASTESILAIGWSAEWMNSPRAFPMANCRFCTLNR